MTSSFVIDVNVGIAANGKSPQADKKCQLKCVKSLSDSRNGIICIDNSDYILSEYRRHLSLSGQPGVGDEFMYWIHENQDNTFVCERVRITKNQKHNRTFDEFPEDDKLHGFDISDRKYVAVALKSDHDPEILNAVDSDWKIFQNELLKWGVKILQLCPNCLKEI